MIIPAHLKAYSLQSTVYPKVRRGFTLIELLIVIAIIGILAAAVLIAVNPAKRQNQAKDANIKSDIGSIATAMQAYYTQPGAGSYPTAAQMAANPNILVSNGDLKQMPTPPAGGSYEYGVNPGACTGTGTSLCVEAYVSEPLFDPLSTGNVFCWESIEGRAEEESVANCIDFSAAT